MRLGILIFSFLAAVTFSAAPQAGETRFLVVLVQPDEGALGAKSALRADIVEGIDKAMRRFEAVAMDGGAAALPNPVPGDLAIMGNSAKPKADYTLGVTTRLLLFQDEEKTVIQIRMLGDLIHAGSASRVGEPLEEKVNYKGPLPCDRNCQFETTRKSLPHISARLSARVMAMAKAAEAKAAEK